IENKGTASREVGLRLLFDTKMGDNDGHPFALPGTDERITTMADWKGQDVPAQILALEKPNPKDPGLTAIFSLKVGGELEQADRVTTTRWPELKELGWEVPVRPIANDAATVLYWNPRALAAGSRREIAFAVGLSESPLGK